MQVSAAPLSVLKFYFRPEAIEFSDDPIELIALAAPGPFQKRTIIVTKSIVDGLRENDDILLNVPSTAVQKWKRAGAKVFSVPLLERLVDRALVKSPKKFTKRFPNPSVLLAVQGLARSKKQVVDDAFLGQFHPLESNPLRGKLGTMGMHRQLLQKPERDFGRITFEWLPKQRSFEWPVLLLHDFLSHNSRPLSLKTIVVVWHWGLLENHYFFDPCQILYLSKTPPLLPS